jgi:hypothetical protein
VQREVDWRHLTAAGVLLCLLLLAGWRLLAGPAAPPNAPAPAGPQARMQDAPEAPLPVSPGR